jgi:hypothetical protein
MVRDGTVLRLVLALLLAPAGALGSDRTSSFELPRFSGGTSPP